MYYCQDTIYATSKCKVQVSSLAAVNALGFVLLLGGGGGGFLFPSVAAPAPAMLAIDPFLLALIAFLYSSSSDVEGEE